MSPEKRALLEALEVERFTIPPRPALTTADVRGWTPEQQAEHRAVLADAVGGDMHAVEWRDAG